MRAQRDDICQTSVLVGLRFGEVDDSPSMVGPGAIFAPVLDTLCGPEMQARRGRGWPVIPTGPNINILGNLAESEVARLLGESEYFVHLCELEASALVVREAMACACRVWTVPQNAQDLKNVALSWEEARTDAEVGMRAAREARESFDWSCIAAQHARVYAETLARWRAAPTSAADAQRRYRHLLTKSTSVGVRLRRLRERVRRRFRYALH